MAAAVSSIQTISFRNNVIRARRWRDESILVSLIFMDGREREERERLESAQNGVTVMIILDSFETEKELRIGIA